jgi:long-subunit acyl-CoA synthetase (AMP-forming)
MPFEGFLRVSSLQVALHRSLIAYRSVVWVLVKLAASATLAQKVPATVKLNLDGREAFMRLGRSRLLVLGQERVLLLHQSLDAIQDTFIVHSRSFVP